MPRKFLVAALFSAISSATAELHSHTASGT